MKKNTNTPEKTEQKVKKTNNPIYTLLDRYRDLCKQANLVPVDISLDDELLYRGCWQQI